MAISYHVELASQQQATGDGGKTADTSLADSTDLGDKLERRRQFLTAVRDTIEICAAQRVVDGLTPNTAVAKDQPRVAA